MPSELRATLAALAALGFAGAASAQAPNLVFTAFHDACMTADVDPAAVTAAAASEGWRDSEAAGQPISGFDVSSKVSKARKIGDADLTLFAWKGAKGPISAAECQMQVSQGDFAALKGAAAASLGFGPAQTAPDKVVFEYAGPVSAPHALTDNSQFETAAGAGGLYLLTVSSDGKSAFMSLLKIHK